LQKVNENILHQFWPFFLARILLEEIEYFFDGMDGIIYGMIWRWVFDGIDFHAGLTESRLKMYCTL
jgi:hypothetical protein